MIGWQALAIAVTVVVGIACCAIGAICLIVAGMSEDVADRREAEREGCVFGGLGIVLMVAAVAVRFW